VLSPQRLHLLPARRVFTQRDKCSRRSEFEHLANLKELQRKIDGKAFEHPPSVWPFLDEPKSLKAIEELPDAGGRDPELTRQFQFIDGGARPCIVSQHPFHESAFDLIRHRDGLRYRETWRRRARCPDETLPPPAAQHASL
jgi:hypothetical protein